MQAQLRLQAFVDAGENNVSNGFYLQNAVRGSYHWKQFSVEAGVQTDLRNGSNTLLNAIDFEGSADVMVKDFPLTLKGFYMVNWFSDLLHERNRGIILQSNHWQHFRVALGTNYKTYSLNRETRESYNLDPATTGFSEKLNLIYLFAAYLNPLDYRWNVGLACTNRDYYRINQSTNPLFNLQGRLHLSSKLSLQMELWYLRAGMFNISAQHFGYFVRTGLQWEL